MKNNDIEEELLLKENYLVANFRLWLYQQASTLDIETLDALNMIRTYLDNSC